MSNYRLLRKTDSAMIYGKYVAATWHVLLVADRKQIEAVHSNVRLAVESAEKTYRGTI
jgi:hypothetical protein